MQNTYFEGPPLYSRGNIIASQLGQFPGWRFSLSFFSTVRQMSGNWGHIHPQLCHTWLNGQHISWRSSIGRCLIIIHRIVQTPCPVISIFSNTSRNSCLVSISILRMTERWTWVSQWFQSQVADLYITGYKSWSHGMTKCLNSRGEYVEKVAQHLLYLFQ